MKMPLVHHLEQHVRGVGTVGEIADLVDDEHAGMGVWDQGLPQPPVPARRGELVDEVRRRHEPGVGPMLDRLVGDGDRHVGLPGTRGSVEQEAPPLRDELRAEVASEQLLAQPGLEGEVELLDGAQEREPRAVRHPRDARLGAVGDLLADEDL